VRAERAEHGEDAIQGEEVEGGDWAAHWEGTLREEGADLQQRVHVCVEGCVCSTAQWMVALAKRV
jgi:hypothetical protein